MNLNANSFNTSDDYHGMVNLEQMKKYFSNKLLPSCPRNAVIVLDNATYHNAVVKTSKLPPNGATIESLKQWLDHYGQEYIPQYRKKDGYPPYSQYLRKLCDDHYESAGIRRTFELQQTIEEFKSIPSNENNNTELLFSPIAHCKFNPIEQVWNVGKNAIRNSEIKDRKMSDNIRIFKDKLCDRAESSTYLKFAQKSQRAEEEMYLDDIRLGHYDPHLIQQ